MKDQLRTLFDYTIFHIGMYATLITALFGLIALSDKAPGLLKMLPFIKWTAFSFVIAGAAGGAVVSNIPESSDFGAFKNKALNVFGIEKLSEKLFGQRTRCVFTYEVFSRIEHLAFWIGIAIATWGFLTLSLPAPLSGCLFPE